jgi:hypothetical protein
MDYNLQLCASLQIFVFVCRCAVISTQKYCPNQHTMSYYWAEEGTPDLLLYSGCVFRCCTLLICEWILSSLLISIKDISNHTGLIQCLTGTQNGLPDSMTRVRSY